MNDAEPLVDEIRSGLRRKWRVPFDAVRVAMPFFLLVHVRGMAEPEVAEFYQQFWDKCRANGFDNLLEDQMSYGIRIARANGDVLYEEMHKLLSLCEDTYALEVLGFMVDQELRLEFVDAVRDRFSRQPRVARMCAEDKLKEWSRDLWWNEIVGPG